jgi:hypothetical protein
LLVILSFFWLDVVIPRLLWLVVALRVELSSQPLLELSDVVLVVHVLSHAGTKGLGNGVSRPCRREDRLLLLIQDSGTGGGM